MSWQIRFTDEACEDLRELTNSQVTQVSKAINRVALNPLPKNEGGRDYDVTETTSFMYLDIPLLLRVKPVSFFSIDAGMFFDFNLSANNALEYEDETMSDDVSASVKPFEFALVCGLGFEVVSDLELNFRALFGMTSLSKNVDKIKHLRLQAGLTYWTF